MNKPIRTISVFCLLLFVALLANVTYLQFLRADGLNDDPNNRRALDERFAQHRDATPLGTDPPPPRDPVAARSAHPRPHPTPPPPPPPPRPPHPRPRCTQAQPPPRPSPASAVPR